MITTLNHMIKMSHQYWDNLILCTSWCYPVRSTQKYILLLLNTFYLNVIRKQNEANIESETFYKTNGLDSSKQNVDKKGLEK